MMSVYHSGGKKSAKENKSAGGKQPRVQAFDLRQDEGVQRDEILMLDLVGMGETGGCLP